MTAIFKRELKAYFYSPMVYIYLTVFFFISGFLFLMSNLAMKTSNMSYVFSGVFTIIMIMLPLLTMRLFSDEKKLKTEQGLLTAPVSLSGIVFGKFFAAFCVFLTGMLVYIPYLFTLNKLAGKIAVPSIICNFVGLILLRGAFISIGLFISSLTEFQIVAAILTFIVNLFLYMIDMLASSVSIDAVKKAMTAIGFYNRYTEFTQGILNVTSVVFFLSVIFIFNFLTVRILEKRRWS